MNADTDETSSRDSLERLFDEFIRRRRSGQALSVAAFAGEHPEEADRIRDLLPLMLRKEALGAAGEATPLLASSMPEVVAGDPRQTEADAYLQERLRLLARALTIMAGVLLVVIRVTDIAVHDDPWLVHLHLGDWWTYAEIAQFAGFAGACFALTRWRFSHERLFAFDALLLFSAYGGAIGIWWGIEWEDIPFFFGFILLFIMLRAIVVPSTWIRTLWVSLPAAPSLLIAQFLRGTRITITGDVIPRDKFIMELCLYQIIILVAIGLAALASRITFILRRRIFEASRLGPYAIEEKIGAGAMGEVYRATHLLLKRPTAIKLMRPGSAGLRSMRRFEREVQQTCRLTHPNTIAIYDYGYTPSGVFYYAMELLDGRSLREVIEGSGPMPAARVIHILVQACGALDEAHALSLIHRDIKPGNIHLCRRGRDFDVVKILDFGLVKNVMGDDVQLTEEGVFVGTPASGAPEMLGGGDIGPAADLYSLATVAYFLLTGRPVFEATTVLEMIGCHQLTDPTPPSRLNPDVPADLEKLILMCLAKEPEDRPRSASALRTALLECEDAGKWLPEDARHAWGSDS